MIRERRSRQKLEAYYNRFIEQGEIDPNVHPWVAKSWAKSASLRVDYEKMSTANRLSVEELKEIQKQNKPAIDYLENISVNVREFFQKYNISLLLLDANCTVLKSYSMPFYQMTPGEIEGVRVGIEDIGTSSISIAYEHKSPFWLFGPEMWAKECQQSDACSAPVVVDNEISYIITFVAVEQSDMPQDAIIAMLLTIKQSLEGYLHQYTRIKAQEAILDATPFAVYHVMAGDEVAYANKLGMSRLMGIGAQKNGNDELKTNLNDVIMNYRHTPIYRGFKGVPSYNKEVTWITQAKTYEDITTVVPLDYNADDTVHSVVAVSMPIEDLRTLVAHAAGFTAKYSLNSLVSGGTNFNSIKDKALRIARNKHHMLIQGESGTGKQRMAHGIHQASPRAAGPLITIHCGDTTPEILEQELFGVALNTDISHPGKLELASGGTLFIDEIEKMPRNIAVELAAALNTSQSNRVGENVERSIDVRIIGACDSDLKRLTERGLFSRELYDIISRSVIRIPSLRNRREDIRDLANHIVNELASQHQMAVKEIAPETVELLMNYDWPGNIKQLQGVIEVAFFKTADGVIRPEDINLMGDVKPDNKWKEDKDIFVKAWKAAGGNVSRMANLLHVSRVTLYRYLKKYGFDKK